MGFRISRRLKDIEQLNWANQKIVERRIQFYFEVAPDLNDLLCFYTYVGNWRETQPPAVITLKRKLDKRFFIHAPIFPADVMEKYIAFINCCYKPFTGWGHTAKIRPAFARRQEATRDWQTDWDSLFVAGEAAALQDVQDRYNDLVGNLAESLGLGIDSPELPRGRVPGGSDRPHPSPRTLTPP